MDKTKSVEKTKRLMIIMQAYIDGQEVQCQRKGLTGWGPVGEIGFMRHQWDSRNENYRVVEDGVVLTEVGIEFDDHRSNENHEKLQMVAVAEASRILGDGETKMWQHYCIPEKGTIYTGIGEECNWCGETKPVILSIA